MSTAAPVELLLDPTVRRGYLVAGWLAHPALLTLPWAVHASLTTAETIGLVAGLASVAAGVQWLLLRRRGARVVVTEDDLEIHSGVADPETVSRGDILAVGVATARHAGGPLFPVLITPDGDGVAVRPLRRSSAAAAAGEARRLAAALGLPHVPAQLDPFCEPHRYRLETATTETPAGGVLAGV